MSTAETITPAFFGDGVPAEIGKIEKELKKLWQEQSTIATRASRLNLVVYSAADSSLRANTAVMRELTRDQACRAILVAARAKSPQNRLRAWVNAHCHLSKAGAKQTCSEQIAFLMEGTNANPKLVSSLVFSHLDSDLPLYLWWQGELPTEFDGRLADATSRIIYDSATWTNTKTQFGLVKELTSRRSVKAIPGDLNWTRASSLRLALAQFFDVPAAHLALDKADRLDLEHSPTGRTTALLLLGWLADALGWGSPEASGTTGNEFLCGRKNSTPVRVVLARKNGAVISRVTLRCGEGSVFTLTRAADSLFYTTQSFLSGADSIEQSIAADPTDPGHLVSEELARGGQRLTYLRSVAKVLSVV